jgi:hypothetical protein
MMVEMASKASPLENFKFGWHARLRPAVLPAPVCLGRLKVAGQRHRFI